MIHLSAKTRKLLRTDKRLIACEVLFVLVLVFTLPVLQLFPFSTIILLSAFAALSLAIRGLGWRDVGLRRSSSWLRTLLQTCVATVLVILLFGLLIQPVTARLTGKPIELSAFSGVKGNVWVLVGWLARVWIMSALLEELVFRGYLLNRIADFLGRGRQAWGIAVLASSVFFGVAHAYQGPAGMLNATVIGVLLGMLYLISSHNLWATWICHSLIDSVSLVAIYFRMLG